MTASSEARKYFEAGWKAAQEFDEAVEKYGDPLPDNRYDLDKRFEELVKSEG